MMQFAYIVCNRRGTLRKHKLIIFEIISQFCDDLHDALSAFFHQNKELNDYNFNHRFRDFIEIVKSKIDKHAPLKKLTRKQRKLKCKPWITRGILTSIKRKQKFIYLTLSKVILIGKMFTKNTLTN